MKTLQSNFASQSIMNETAQEAQLSDYSQESQQEYDSKKETILVSNYFKLRNVSISIATEEVEYQDESLLKVNKKAKGTNKNQKLQLVRCRASSIEPLNETQKEKKLLEIYQYFNYSKAKKCAYSSEKKPYQIKFSNRQIQFDLNLNYIKFNEKAKNIIQERRREEKVRNLKSTSHLNLMSLQLSTHKTRKLEKKKSNIAFYQDVNFEKE